MKTPAMNRLTPGLCLSVLLLVLSSCHTPPGKEKASAPTWKVEPVMRTGQSPLALRYAESFYRLGRYQDLQGRAGPAEDYYRKAIAADSGHAEAHNALGVLLAESNRLAEGLSMLERAAGLMPENASYRNNLGYARFLAGQLDAARAQFHEALRLAPGNLHAAQNLQLLTLPEQTPLVAQPAVPVLRTAPSLVLSETAAQRIEMSFPGQSTSPAPGVVEPARLAVVVPLPEPSLAVAAAAGRVSEAPPAWSMAISEAPVSRSYRLEISNAMGMRGAARRVNRMLMREGSPPASLNDQRPFNQQRSQVLYARGYEEDAQRLAQRLGAQAQSSRDLLGVRAVHLRIVLGKDVRPLVASLPENDLPQTMAGWAPPALSAGGQPWWLASRHN